MSAPDSNKLERIEELLRKSLLGQEVINTQFHLFSAKSVLSGRLTRPRVLCANNVLLAQSSKYFLDLLSSDANPSDGSLSDLADAADVPSCVRVDDYGYESDSDLDDDEDPVPVADAEPSKDESASPPPISITTQPKDDEESPGDDSDSVSSDMFVMSPEHPRTDEPSGKFGIGSATSSGGTAVEKSPDSKLSKSQTAMRLRSLASRHILIKDTAFRTWYTLLNYLYTDKVNFLPLSSAASEEQCRESSLDFLDEPECSAKSMYRLACKVGLDQLRDEALAHIRSNLTEDNVLKELSCRFVSSHPELLEMELDLLYTHIGSPSVVSGFPALAQRIAQKELPHGAEIIVGIHSRILKGLPSLPSTPMPSISSPASASLGPLSPPPQAEPVTWGASGLFWGTPAVPCDALSELIPEQPCVDVFGSPLAVPCDAPSELIPEQSCVDVFGSALVNDHDPESASSRILRSGKMGGGKKKKRGGMTS